MESLRFLHRVLELVEALPVANKDSEVEIGGCSSRVAAVDVDQKDLPRIAAGEQIGNLQFAEHGIKASEQLDP